jgi:hypothetical protein
MDGCCDRCPFVIASGKAKEVAQVGVHAQRFCADYGLAALFSGSSDGSSTVNRADVVRKMI